MVYLRVGRCACPHAFTGRSAFSERVLDLTRKADVARDLALYLLPVPGACLVEDSFITGVVARIGLNEDCPADRPCVHIPEAVECGSSVWDYAYMLRVTRVPFVRLSSDRMDRGRDDHVRGSFALGSVAAHICQLPAISYQVAGEHRLRGAHEDVQPARAGALYPGPFLCERICKTLDEVGEPHVVYVEAFEAPGHLSAYDPCTC